MNFDEVSHLVWVSRDRGLKGSRHSSREFWCSQVMELSGEGGGGLVEVVKGSVR